MVDLRNLPTFEKIEELEIDSGIKACLSYGIKFSAKWLQQARPEQLQPDPDMDWETHLLMMGRGGGKTFSNINNVLCLALLTPGLKVCAIAPTYGDVEKIIFKEGVIRELMKLDPSIGMQLVKGWNKKDNVLELPNGSTIYGFSSESPERLRGNQFHIVWVTELAYCENQLYLLEQIDLVLRLITDGLGRPFTARLLVDTTPARNSRALRILRDDPKTITVYGSSLANADNLSKRAVRRMKQLIKTDEELARQEIFGELLLDDDGTILPAASWRMWQARNFPKPERVVVSADTAYKVGKDSDFTACTVWAICPRHFEQEVEQKLGNGNVIRYRKVVIRYIMILVKAWRRRLQFFDLQREIQKTYDEQYALLGLEDTDSSKLLCLVEDKGSGQSLIQEFERMGVPTVAWKTGTRSKVDRAELAASILRSGNVWAPMRLNAEHDIRDPSDLEETGPATGRFAEKVKRAEIDDRFEYWAQAVIRELDEFPTGEKDDYVDSCAQAWNFFREQGYLDIVATDRYYESRSDERTRSYGDDDFDNETPVTRSAAYG